MPSTWASLSTVYCLGSIQHTNVKKYLPGPLKRLLVGSCIEFLLNRESGKQL